VRVLGQLCRQHGPLLGHDGRPSRAMLGGREGLAWRAVLGFSPWPLEKWKKLHIFETLL
jgi:hypothetical protein